VEEILVYKSMDKFKLSPDQLILWGKNLLMFTAPILAVFFGQLALGVDWKKAIWVAVLALYGLLSDYLKKLNA
jgi:hypothetical protein